MSACDLQNNRANAQKKGSQQGSTNERVPTSATESGGLGNSAHPQITATAPLGWTSQMFPDLDRASWDTFGEELLANPVSALGLSGLLGGESEDAEQPAPQAAAEQSNEAAPAPPAPPATIQTGAYEWSVHDEGTRFVLVSSPDGQGLQTEVTTDTATAYATCREALREAMAAEVTEVPAEAQAVEPKIDDLLPPTPGPEPDAGSGILQQLASGARAIDEADKAYNPLRWARDAAAQGLAGGSANQQNQEADGTDGGWGEYVPAIARGLYDGFYGADQQVVEAVAVAEPEVEQRPVEADQGPEGQRILQVDLIEEMLRLGYNEDGSQATRYGGFSGHGDKYSNGEGGFWVASGSEDPIRCEKVDMGIDEEGKPVVEWHWIGKSGTDYGRRPTKVFRSSNEYHCVGAVSTVLEAAGLYEGGDTELSGRSTVTHKKNGDREDGNYLKSTVNVATFSAGTVDDAVRSDRGILDTATVAAQADARSRMEEEGWESEDDPRFKAFVLHQAYDALLTSEDRDARLAGSATALVQADLGEEINPTETKPGDTCQHWSTETSGHSTLVHVVLGFGVAKVDESGVVATEGSWRDGDFQMDNTTDPSLVGKHVVTDVRLLGAHSVGTTDYNRDEAQATDGIHTGAARAVGSKKLEYYGRPNNSPWVGWTPEFSTVADALATTTETGGDLEVPSDASGGGQYEWGEWIGGSLKGASERLFGRSNESDGE